MNEERWQVKLDDGREVSLKSANFRLFRDQVCAKRPGDGDCSGALLDAPPIQPISTPPKLMARWRGSPPAGLEQLPKRDADHENAKKKNDDAPRGGTASEQLRPADADGGGQLAEMLVKVSPSPCIHIRVHCHPSAQFRAACVSCRMLVPLQASIGAAKKHWMLR